MMKSSIIGLMVFCLLTITFGPYRSAQADTVTPGNYYTWGIDENELGIQDGYIITEAVLTVHNVTSANENINDTLSLYLIDRPALGFVANGNLEAAPFSQTGILLTPAYQDAIDGTEDLAYRFSDTNDPASHFWKIFTYPITFGINSSLTIDSSLLLETIDYSGNKTPFGFGLDLQGDDSFTFDSITLQLTVESFENQPDIYTIEFTTDLLTPIGDRSVIENQLLTFVVNQTEPHGDPITYDLQNLPEGATYTNRTFAWTPTHAQIGDHIVTFTADNGSLQDAETVTITVISSNTAPVLTPIGSKNVNENTLLTFNINATDADADTIVYSAQNLPAGALLTGTTFTWTPDYTRSGTYQVTFLADDGQETDSETITITVNDINTTPVLASIADSSVDENTLLTFDITATDADGDTIVYSAQNLPTGAVFTGTNFTWTPTYEQDGIYSLTFNATDGTWTDSQNVTITVNNVNRDPVLTTIPDRTVDENATLTFTINATDPDGTNITYSMINAPAGAVLTGNTFTWTPNYDQNGIYSVTFSATDGQATDSQTVNITVNNVNRNPVLATIGNRSVDEGSALIFNINATDDDGDSLTYSANNLPASAAFIGNTFSWTPDYNQAGTYTLTFYVTDGIATDTETVTITVHNLNRAPVLDTIDDQTVDEDATLTFDINATDADGDQLTYSTQTMPAGAVFSGNTFTWTPAAGQDGTHTVTFVVTDTMATDLQTITITVNPIDHAPVLDHIDDVTVDERKTITIYLNATDIDGDAITYSALGMPDNAALEGNKFTWRPWYTDAGTYQLTFTASGGLLQTSQTVTITVNEVKLASWYDRWLRHLGKL